MKLMSVLCVSIALFLGACGSSSANLTTDTRSSAFATDAEKITFLRRYLHLKTPIQATEFHIVYHDNSGGGVPGPSDYDLRVALLIDQPNLDAWTAGLHPSPESEATQFSWSAEVLPHEARWALTSKPTIYVGDGANELVAVFATEGIILIHSWTT